MRALCISLVLMAALAGNAIAQQAPAEAQTPEALNKVYACAAVAGAEARLACFDAAVAAMRSAEAQGEFAAVDANRVRQIERESFGFSLPSLPRLGLLGRGRAADTAALAEPPSTQTMRIARTSRFDGRDSFVMDNGQVWVLIEAKENRHARQGAEVTIRKAALGSYLLSVEAGGAALRVRRAQ